MKNSAFSVVMSVYKNDHPEYFKQAVDSVLNQSLAPSEIIIVVDGDVTKAIRSVLSSFRTLKQVKIHQLQKNSGLGLARDYGIRKSSSSIVAVMDSDDISLPDRFQTQLEFLRNQNAAMVGGYIEEFMLIPGDCGLIRKVPLNHKQIITVGRWRQSMNHVTIMFKKSIYFKSGGYRDVRGIEDFDLFYRIFLTGAKVCNVNQVLVNVRFNEGTVLRRRGWQYYKAMVGIYTGMVKTGYISMFRFMFLSFVQFFVRLLPPIFLGFAYKLTRDRAGIHIIAKTS